LNKYHSGSGFFSGSFSSSSLGAGFGSICESSFGTLGS